jgi:hypothetical protein
MAATILASVGLRGANRRDDVLTIQNLLNRIDPAKGGPTVKLDPDGRAGTKTNGAIQRFQLEHFGFKGADGRVDPGGRTLAKLNELTGGAAPVDPVVFGSFEVRQATLSPRVTDPKFDFCFLVTAFGTQASQAYFFQPPGVHAPGQFPRSFPGRKNEFGVSPKLPITSLGGGGLYVTRFRSEGPSSFLQLSGLFGTRVLTLGTHLAQGDAQRIGGPMGKSTADGEELSGSFLML